MNAQFPCIEQPTRVTLHCNGYYLWGKRNGKLTCRQKRNEKDEFLLQYDKEGTLSIQHYKFKGTMTVTRKQLEDGTTKTSIKCLKDEEQKEAEDKIKQAVAEAAAAAGTNVEEETKAEEEEEEEAVVASINEDDQKWCFIKGAADSIHANAILLKSLSTGMNMGINDDGKLFFANDADASTNVKQIYWTVECVTGELCFLSNPKLQSQLRCDMAGLLTIDANKKGWEVFRFMEAGHGYVKISSWMHSQWLVCSTKDGNVSTCSHAESFQDFRPTEEDDAAKAAGKAYKCSQWAIEKSPDGNGVTLRSKTHGRFLSILDNGELKTYHPSDDDEDDADAAISPDDATKPAATTAAAAAAATNDPSKTSWKSFKTSMRTSMDGARKSLMTTQKEGPIVPQGETTVWQLDAAHSQNYFFLNLNMEDAKAKSIGPGLQVSSNLRKNTKIQLIRNVETGITKLCIEGDSSSSSSSSSATMKKKKKSQYLACVRDGTISLIEDDDYVDVEWVMEKSLVQEGFTAFRSKAHDLYLSFRPMDCAANNTESTFDKMNSLIGKEKEILEELVGSQACGATETWKLDPCMPRAVSSDKIKTFAIGTTIAVGTTVAMPFALAGVAGLMGAIGAEVGTFTTLIFAGLTGAEAIASVGAIGATAYIIFKPEENSLTDDHNKEEEEEEKAWSKRPLSNWRDW